MRLPWRSRRQRDAELDEEIRTHLRMAEAGRVARGAEARDAAHAARREFGNVTQVKDVTRGAWRGRLARATWNAAALERLRQDIGYALRGMRRAPGFTATIVLTLALGVGANSAIFSFLDGVFFKPPSGVRAPEEIRRLYIRANRPSAPNGVLVYGFFNYSGYAVVRDAMHHAANGALDVAAFTPPTSSMLTNGGIGEVPVAVSYVSQSYFATLGTRMAFGRYFDADESRVEVPAAVAVISYSVWTHAFARDSAIIGRYADIGSRRFTIVGVTAPGFSGIDVNSTGVFLPLGSFTTTAQRGVPWYRAGGNYFNVFARVPRTHDERESLARATVAHNSQPPIPFTTVDTTRMILAGPISRARGPEVQGKEVAISTRVAGVAAVVLLIACANMANLLLVRGMRRRREVAVRLALGVSRKRLFAQLLTESVCLAALGGAAALGVAWWGGKALRTMLLPGVTWAGGVVDLRVMALTGLIAVAAGLLAGVAPVLQARRLGVADALKAGAREGAYQKSRLRTTLLVTQAALSVVLIAGAGLFVRSLGSVRAIDIGYDSDSLAFVSPGSARTVGEQREYHDAVAQLADRMRKEPGVLAATPASIEPMRGWTSVFMSVPGRDSAPRISGPEPTAQFNTVAPGFFSTVGVRIVAGRAFAENEPANSIIVNETMARVFWPGKNALGECIIFDARPTDPCTYVVGVSEDAHRWRIVEEPNMQYFRPGGPMPLLILRIDPARWASIAERARAELAVIAPAARQVSTMRMTERFDTELRPWRTGAALFTAFGVLALLVAAVGVYSVVAFTVSQRIHEMGVRIALGARMADMLALVVGQGLRVMVVGAVIGVGVALALGKFVASMLHGVTARDPLVMIISAVVLLAVATVASLVPAWRAARVDPVTALRAD